MIDRHFGHAKSYAIPVWNGLLEHWKRMGSAIWEFLWCLDKITREYPDNSGRKTGVVLNGKPIAITVVSRDLGRKDEKSVRKNFEKLERGAYIRRPRRTPYGYTIEVLNSHKFGIWGSGARTGKNTHSQIARDRANMPAKNGAKDPPTSVESTRCRSDSALDTARNTAGCVANVFDETSRVESAAVLLKRTLISLKDNRGMNPTADTIAKNERLILVKDFEPDKRQRFRSAIYRKGVRDAYFDARVSGRKSEALAIQIAIDEACRSLLSALGRALGDPSKSLLSSKAWKRIEPHVSAVSRIGAYHRRETQVLDVVLNAVADAALEIEQSRQAPAQTTAAAAI